jgi:hypothetical protein
MTTNTPVRPPEKLPCDRSGMGAMPKARSDGLIFLFGIFVEISKVVIGRAFIIVLFNEVPL